MVRRPCECSQNPTPLACRQPDPIHSWMCIPSVAPSLVFLDICLLNWNCAQISCLINLHILACRHYILPYVAMCRHLLQYFIWRVGTSLTCTPVKAELWATCCGLVGGWRVCECGRAGVWRHFAKAQEISLPLCLPTNKHKLAELDNWRPSIIEVQYCKNTIRHTGRPTGCSGFVLLAHYPCFISLISQVAYDQQFASIW